jgi:hypothetical protein
MIQTALIIPIYNQKKYWKRMLSMIERMWVKPSYIYVMLDRQSISDYNYIKTLCDGSDESHRFKVFNMNDVPEFVGRPNHLPEQDLFLTGYRRNQAIDMAIEDGCTSFVFIDGDCLPQPDLIAAHNRANSRNLPNLSVGRRREEKHGWKDQREFSPNLKHLKLFDRVDENVITDFELLKTSAITWSCNMSMNIQAVNRLKNFNQYYYGRPDIFHSDFLGTWGGEDGFIGVEAYYCNIFITVINDKKSGIKHIEHERPINKYSGDAFQIYLEQQILLLQEMIANKPVSLDLFEI